MFTFTDKEVGQRVTYEKCFNDLYDLYKYKNFKNKLVLVFEDRIVYELPLKIISVKWAVVCAEKCLHIFEKARPKDNRPKKAIEAAKQWIIDQTNATAAAASAAADASSAAYAYSTFAAYSASSAASAAAFSADAADSDADAAGYAAAAYAYYTAAYAAYAAYSIVATTTEQEWSRNKLNEIVEEYINNYRRDLKNTLKYLNIIPELSNIIINYVI